MKELMKQIEEKTKELELQICENEFRRNGFGFTEGKVSLVLEAGMYVIYQDNEATHTFEKFEDGLGYYKQLINKTTNE